MTLIQTAVAVTVGLGATMVLASTIAPRVPKNYSALDLSGDPALGTKLKAAVTGFSNGRWMVVYLGDCSSCSASPVDPKMLPAKEFVGIVLVHEPNTPKKSLPTGLASNVSLIPRTQVQGFDAMNPLWPGRWYVFAEGALTRLQKSGEDRSWNDGER